MENRLFTSDQSLNVKIGEEHDTEWQDLIEDKQETPVSYTHLRAHET